MNQTSPPAPLWRGGILIALMVAFIVRLIVALDADPLTAYEVGSADSGWYLANAYALVTNQQPSTMLTEVSNLASPPLYFIFLGIPQAIFTPFPSPDAVIVVRVVQAVLGALTCAFAAGIAFRLTESRRAALLTAWTLALHPALMLESAQILTETLFIFLLAGGVYWLLPHPLIPSPLHKEGERPPDTLPLHRERGLGGEVLSALFFGLATLTRAVLIPFPLMLIVFAALIRFTTWRRALAFIVVYVAVVGSWTVYSVARWNRFVIAGEGLPAFIYLGAAGWDDPTELDENLLESGGAIQTDSGELERDFGGAAGAAIMSDPAGYIRRRASEFASAYMQPHGTTLVAGRSLRDLIASWWSADRMVSGLIAVTQGDSFWIKLALYMVHYGGLIFGTLGLIRLLRRRETCVRALIVFAPIAYFTAVHLVLYALPRYLFPTMIFWWVLAWSFSASNRRATKPPRPSSLMDASSRPT